MHFLGRQASQFTHKSIVPGTSDTELLPLHTLDLNDVLIKLRLELLVTLLFLVLSQ